jgi:ATP-binding cassette subfamily F protein 3
VLSASGLSVSHGSRVLFSDVSLQLRAGRRCALVGGNGVGKTTLIEILVGIGRPDSGEVHRPAGLSLGYLPQELVDDSTGSVLAEVRAGAKRLIELEHSLERLMADMGSTDPDVQERALNEYGSVQHEFEAHGGYDLDARVRRILAGLGFREEDMDRPFAELSGGWRMRAALARLLVAEPDVLVLDEPTNHLDTDSVAWLEDQLHNFSGSVLFVSHDRDFIDNIATHVAELANGTLATYTGGFAEFVVQREDRIAQLEAAAAQQRREAAKVERFIERFRYKATKARQVQSRLKTLARLEEIEVPQKAELVARFAFPEPRRSARVVVDLEDVTAGYGDGRAVLSNVNMVVERGHKLALVGPNGAGKSTLLRTIVGELAPLTGHASLGNGVDVAHFEQHQAEVLPLDRTVLQVFQGAAGPQPPGRNLRTSLGSFGFSGDAVDTLVRDLSGGERTRLALAMCLVNPVNLLILDEPTNHLDLPSCDLLEDALTAYPGTVLLVSHDRHLIRAVADDLIEVRHGRVRLHNGVDEAVLSPSFEGGSVTAKAPGSSSTAPNASPSTGPTTRDEPSTKRTSKADQRRAGAAARQSKQRSVKPLRDAARSAERELAKAEAAVAELNRQLAEPETYADPELVAELGQQFALAKDRATHAMEKWLAATEALEAAQPE